MNSELYYKNETTTSRNIGTIDSCGISKPQKENLIKNLENEKEINAKRIAEIHRYLFPELSEEIKKIYDILIKIVEKLEQENKQLKEKIKQYENPEDLTLMFMYCEEKAKDKIKELQEENIQLKEQVSDINFKLEYEKENLKFNKDYSKSLEQKIKQRDEIIDESIKFCNYLLKNNEVEIDNERYFKHSCDDIITNAILKKLQKYKGDSK